MLGTYKRLMSGNKCAAIALYCLAYRFVKTKGRLNRAGRAFLAYPADDWAFYCGLTPKEFRQAREGLEKYGVAFIRFQKMKLMPTDKINLLGISLDLEALALEIKNLSMDPAIAEVEIQPKTSNVVFLSAAKMKKAYAQKAASLGKTS